MNSVAFDTSEQVSWHLNIPRAESRPMPLDYSRIPASMLTEKDIPGEWLGVLMEGIDLEGRTLDCSSDDLFDQPVYVSGAMLDPEEYLLGIIDWSVYNREAYSLATALAAMHGVRSDNDEVGEPDSRIFWKAYPDCMSEEALISLLDFLRTRAL